MLKVYAGIADEGFLGRVLQDVNEGLVGERPGIKDRFASIEIGSPSAVEAENRSSGEVLPPEDLAVIETGSVEFATAIVATEAVEVSPTHR